MNRIISLPKSVFEELVTRLNRLETIVFGKSQSKTTEEYIKLSPAAKKRYKKIDEDIKNGKNIYAFNDKDDGLKFLLSDKR
ncbi:MAG: hypothetical protein US40_C0004G0005 [Candidatus Roizmanbacteria bacterium GW2011_GWC2_37_13]|uniref:Uncharacterized protein n=1 Tax=Candidatus Roizmanbacteria bacterium GW2011_GWC2_37_13 TaxID=1618486 RepID=A0A0G0GIN2_9BACT|nr:MAG: hypothetical protein US40_C0004G0005 [Candidatus Roizmanbacteria bacterium GW2011_GWC2_37_13]